MAMEKLYTARDTHSRSITAIGYSPARREIMMGCEDGVIKTWEADTGKAVSTFYEHKGWVTDFLYWSDAKGKLKLMFSSANDGVIAVWSSGGGLADKIMIGQPVYCMGFNPRRHQMICGVNGGIRVYDFDEKRECGHYINTRVRYIATEHTDIVRCIVCHESRVYSAGYDQKMIIYDSSYTGDESMVPIYENPNAHDAGISCLMLVKDNENNTWVVTGSFDKTVRIWSTDGKLVHRLEGFISTVTGICYVPRNKTIWAAGGTSYAYLYDPKSGDNVSDFIGTFQTQEEEKYHLQLLKYFPELNQVVGTTSRRHMMVWKYNTSGCITALKCKASLESLAYTKKIPLLIFSGDAEGIITKWERMQSNHFMYRHEGMNITTRSQSKSSRNKEFFLLSDAKKAKKKKKEREKEEKEEKVKDDDRHILEENKRNKPAASHYQFSKPTMPPVPRLSRHRTNEISAHNHPHTTILQILFVEELDLIIAACEDSNIYVWGFDEDAVKALKTMEQPDSEKQLVRKFAILLGHDSELLQEMKIQEEDSVTNRVAGFMCKHILSEHTSCVTSLAIIGRDQGFKGTYVLSAGWDRRICIWDLEQGILHDTFRNPSLTSSMEHVELAADGIITQLTYCPRRNEFAYSSSDKMVYIRRFSTNGVDMVLLNTLQGHFGEVTSVKWNGVKEKWVTGSEDGTIRIWSGEGLNECEQVLAAQGSVTSLGMDVLNGAIIAGVQDTVRVYEAEQYRLVQTNFGHKDSVRSILHIPERNQYVTSSWDRTIRIWNAWKAPKKKRKVSKDKRAQGLSMQPEREEPAESDGESPEVPKGRPEVMRADSADDIVVPADDSPTEVPYSGGSQDPADNVIL